MKVRLILVIGICALFFPGQLVFAQNLAEYPDYVIQPGDSLGYIADLFDTSVEEIVQLNNISDPDLISPGQMIKIPGFQGIQGTLSIISTDLGENFTYLPVKFQTDQDILIRINRLLSPTQVYAGSELIIPIPGNSDPLIPVSKIQENESGLETAVSLGINLQTLSLLNSQNDVNLAIAESILFAPATSERIALDLYAPPISEVVLSPLPLVQGGTEVIYIKSDHPIKLSGDLGGHPLNFFSENSGEYYALQGVYAMAEPGLTDFSLTGIFEDGNTYTFVQKILVVPGDFNEDPPLIVDPKTIDPSVTEPENELVLSLVSKVTPTKYWSEIFNSPAVYQEYNSLFGTRRRYNDDPTVTFHTGVDFAGGLTLPITAPAPGQVVFAGPLTVRGNAVFIDHGWGVFSGFFHQDTLLVKVGDFVTTGQQIGTVGNTGRVNGAGDYYGAGAHLHWELWVNGVQVDPLDWLSLIYP